MREPPPDYGIIYNWDGAPLHYSEYPQSVEQFVQKNFAPVEDTQVGALFWCVGVHEAGWPSETMEVAGDTVGRVYPSLTSMRHAENVRAMFDRGENPYDALVERGQELGVDVWASVRMNDNHMSGRGLKVEELAGMEMSGLTQLRKDHPEWLLTEETAQSVQAVGSWNFAIPEVREHRLQHITEACEVAGWDGVELDWQRHAFHLPANDAHRLRYTLTDLQRSVREMTDRIASERGRPFHVAVRVGATMEACRNIGYDVETWVKDGLCDIVIAGGNSGFDPGIEVEAFARIVEGTPAKFYAGFDTDGRARTRRLMSYPDWRDAWNRACAMGYWDQGAHGMYAFNWHATESTFRSLLTTIGSPDTLDGTDKVYSAVHRTSGADGRDVNDRIYGETPVALYATTTGEGPSFNVPVHDEVARHAANGRLESVELHIQMEHYTQRDRVEVALDGSVLIEPAVRVVAAEDDSDPSDTDESSWLVWSLEPDQADYGPHRIQVILLDHDPRIKPPLVVQQVEFVVRYIDS